MHVWPMARHAFYYFEMEKQNTYPFFAFLMALFLWGFYTRDIYQLTFVKWTDLLLIFVCSVLFFLVIWKFFRPLRHSGKSAKLITLSSVWYSLAFGIFLSCCLLILNYHLAEETNILIEQHEILDKKKKNFGSGRSSHYKPVFYIDRNGFRKGIVFPANVAKSMEHYKKVKLETAPGRLGYDIIRHRSLIVDE